jgi:hypothetical protein
MHCVLLALQAMVRLHGWHLHMAYYGMCGLIVGL